MMGRKKGGPARGGVGCGGGGGGGLRFALPHCTTMYTSIANTSRPPITAISTTQVWLQAASGRSGRCPLPPLLSCGAEVVKGTDVVVVVAGAKVSFGGTVVVEFVSLGAIVVVEAPVVVDVVDG